MDAAMLEQRHDIVKSGVDVSDPIERLFLGDDLGFLQDRSKVRYAGSEGNELLETFLLGEKLGRGEKGSLCTDPTYNYAAADTPSLTHVAHKEGVFFLPQFCR
jgi:hypothetical protein